MPDHPEDSVSLIFGAHFNALSIIQSLKALGISPDTIYLVRLKGEPKLSASFFNPGMKTWTLDISKAEELPNKIHDKFGIKKQKVLFFTDEQYLAALKKARSIGNIPDIHFLVGSDKYLDTILNRFEFYKFIEKHNIASVPHTINGDENPFEIFDTPIVLRPKMSWPSFRNQQRVRFITSKADLKEHTSSYRNAGLCSNDWCFQELLSTESGDVLSVCGWYDENESYLFCTRKLLLHPEPFGVGDVVKLTSENPDNIIEKTRALLNVLEYKGPFELEWIFDRKKGVYKILEINPRFWMQNGLINRLTGNKIVSLYHGIFFNINQITTMESNIVYWVNPLNTLFRLIKGDFRGLKYYFSAKSISPIKLLYALIYSPFHILGKLNQNNFNK